MLSGTVAGQGVKAVAGRVAQVVERLGSVDHRELGEGTGLNFDRQDAAAPACPDALGFTVLEVCDHGCLYNVQHF